MKNSFNKNNLYLAELKYFNLENNGIEVAPATSYAVLYKVDDKFINVLNPLESYPVFERVKFRQNYARNEESYGTKMKQVGDSKLSSEPCYVLCGNKIFKEFNNDELSQEEIENFVLKSKHFFKDRIKLYNKNLKKLNLLGVNYLKYKEDKKNYQDMVKFFDDRLTGNVKIKK